MILIGSRGRKRLTALRFVGPNSRHIS